MTLTTGRWTLWTYGAHPFAPAGRPRAAAARACALRAEGGMTTWLYLIVTMRDDATTGGHQDVNGMERSMINSRLYSTRGGD